MVERPPTRSAAPASVPAMAGFADAIFEPSQRADQRWWAQAYLYGLLHAQGRKTVRQLAAQASGRDSAADALRRFVNDSPWDWRPVRRGLARWVEQRAEVQAWILGPAILPKRGPHSCGAHRRFVPELGRVINCQAALGLFLSTPDADYPVDWSLALPDSWSTDARLRERARIPEPVTQQPPWQRALSIIEQTADGASRPPVPIVADLADLSETTDTADTADIASLADALSRAGCGFVLTAKRPDGSAGIALTNLNGRHASRVLELAGRHARTRATVSTLDEHGLLDFEGRSFPGWHHHMTLVSAAYSYRRLAGRAEDPARSEPGARP